MLYVLEWFMKFFKIQKKASGEKEKKVEDEESVLFTSSGDCVELIATVCGMGLDIDDNNEPASENVPQPTAPTATTTTQS
eukprot:1265118-Ditylum_brightwellii.AAC.1